MIPPPIQMYLIRNHPNSGRARPLRDQDITTDTVRRQSQPRRRPCSHVSQSSTDHERSCHRVFAWDLLQSVWWGSKKAVNQHFVGELPCPAEQSSEMRLGHVTAPARMEAVNLIAALGCGNCFLQSSVTSTKTTKRCRGWTAEFRGGDEFPLGVTRTGRWTSKGVSGVRQESNPRALNESIPSHREKAFAQPRERLSGRFTPLDTNERSWMAHMLTSAIADG